MLRMYTETTFTWDESAMRTVIDMEWNLCYHLHPMPAFVTLPSPGLESGEKSPATKLQMIARYIDIGNVFIK